MSTHYSFYLSVGVVLSAALLGARGDMYDVLEPLKVAPSECSSGCEDWTKQSKSIWAVSENAAKANSGSGCAQPGKIVNSRTNGAWCFCRENTTNEVKVGDYPFENKTVYLFNTAEGADLFVSFANTDAPPGFTGGQEWLRARYSAQTDAIPIRMIRDPQGRADTYIMYCEYPGAENFISFTTDKAGAFMRAFYPNQADAMPLQLIPQGERSGEYYLFNKYQGYNTYVGLDKKDSLTWLRADVPTKDGAITVKLIPAIDPNAKWGYCTSKDGVPEQINVQLGGPQSVVISWVTFGDDGKFTPPTATVNGKVIEGVTHTHVTAAGDRTYYMHFVRVGNLLERKLYSYSVKSGSSGAVESSTFSFRSPYSTGETKLDIYGDMGVYEWNNMDQLLKDAKNGDADAIIHLGDHAYNEGDSDERRADGYMSAWQPILSQTIPWVPVVGNHEYYSGAELYRFLNQTFEGWAPIPGGNVDSYGGQSTADSSLGALLSIGNYHAAGKSGTVPSNTSRYFSVNIGLVHFIALDLNFYYGVDPCGDVCRLAQIAWLKEDLAAANANRDAVPWIVAGSHFPFYCTGCTAKQMSAEYYASSDAEIFGNVNMSAAKKYSDIKTLEAGSAASISDLMPIMQDNSVDLYVAGHWHYYESLFPGALGSTGAGGVPISHDFVNPNVTVHVTSGNGGPPGKDNFHEACPGPSCGKINMTRKQTMEYSYGRINAYNRTHLQFTQLFNTNGTVFDQWMIVQESHGTFPPHP